MSITVDRGFIALGPPTVDTTPPLAVPPPVLVPEPIVVPPPGVVPPPVLVPEPIVVPPPVLVPEPIVVPPPAFAVFCFETTHFTSFGDSACLKNEKEPIDPTNVPVPSGRFPIRTGVSVRVAPASLSLRTVIPAGWPSTYSITPAATPDPSYEASRWCGPLGIFVLVLTISRLPLASTSWNCKP